MKNRAVVVIVGVVLAVYFFSLPYLTVNQIKDAVRDKDSEALSEHIDFVLVRQSFKDQIKAKLAGELGGRPSDNPFAAMGAALGTLFVDELVDAYVTPSALAMIMRGEDPNVKPSRNSAQKSREEPFENARSRFESLSKFSVTMKSDQPGEEVKFILRRDFLTWRLSEILLPL